MSSHKVEEQDDGYETPPMCDLLTLLLKNRRPSTPCDEVWPDIFISNASTARDTSLLNALNISHIINAAHGPSHIDTGADFYSHTNIQYYGVEAPDRKDFDMTPFFHPTASFIHNALYQQKIQTSESVYVRWGTVAYAINNPEFNTHLQPDQSSRL